MVEYLAKVAVIHPAAARRATIKMFGFVSGRIAPATAKVLPARELNDPGCTVNHLVSPMREPRPLLKGGVLRTSLMACANEGI